MNRDVAFVVDECELPTPKMTFSAGERVDCVAFLRGGGAGSCGAGEARGCRARDSRQGLRRGQGDGEEDGTSPGKGEGETKHKYINLMKYNNEGGGKGVKPGGLLLSPSISFTTKEESSSSLRKKLIRLFFFFSF